jgi:hypothetical protein
MAAREKEIDVSTTEGPDGRARLLYSATMSLDGYISGPAGDQAWLARHLGPNPLIDDLVEAVAVAQAAARGTKYVNVLGADVARQCIELGEVDEILAIVAPVLLGGGTRFFPDGGRGDVALERLSVESLPHATLLWWRVRH